MVGFYCFLSRVILSYHLSYRCYRDLVLPTYARDGRQQSNLNLGKVLMTGKGSEDVDH